MHVRQTDGWKEGAIYACLFINERMIITAPNILAQKPSFTSSAGILVQVEKKETKCERVLLCSKKISGSSRRQSIMTDEGNAEIAGLILSLLSTLSTAHPKHVSCKSSPCINGGTCHQLTHTYYCECPSNYRGSNCESKLGQFTCMSSRTHAG